MFPSIDELVKKEKRRALVDGLKLPFTRKQTLKSHSTNAD
jgi:hypothetical protein